ncbi:MAG: histidinol dehydrogenase [Actinobacteria bacterium]|nr:histidinol dehydrogenase [Actinomycetota bacterium]
MRFSWTRLGAWVVALVVGAVYGVACTIAQSSAVGWFPLGLVLAIVGTAALLAALRLLTSDRWTALACGLGVMIATQVFSGKGPGGSVVVPSAAEGQINSGLIWVIAVPILVAIVVAWPDLSRIRRPTQEN